MGREWKEERVWEFGMVFFPKKQNKIIMKRKRKRKSSKACNLEL